MSPVRQRGLAGLTPSLIENCLSCGSEVRYKLVTVNVSRLARIRCDACGVRIKPSVSRRDGQRKMFAVGSPDMAGLEVLVCKECTQYCPDCRYDFEDE